MTRKDYELIAKAIRDTQERIKNDATNEDRTEQLRGVRRTAAHIAQALAADNGRFDAGRFLTACGYGATSMNPRDPALDLRPLPGQEGSFDLYDRGDVSDDSEPTWR